MFTTTKGTTNKMSQRRFEVIFFSVLWVLVALYLIQVILGDTPIRIA